MNNKIKGYFNRVINSLTNLILDMLNKEKKMSNLEWYSYMYYRLEDKLIELEDAGVLKEGHNFKVHIDLGYNHLLYECEVYGELDNVRTIEEYNNFLKNVADKHVDEVLNKELNKYLEDITNVVD